MKAGSVEIEVFYYLFQMVADAGRGCVNRSQMTIYSLRLSIHEIEKAESGYH